MDKQEILDYVMNTPGNTNRAVLSSMLDGVDGLKIYICTSEEYDATSKTPIIEKPNTSLIYLVPTSEESGDLFDEFIWTGEVWERFGAGSVNVPNPIEFNKNYYNLSIGTNSSNSFIKSYYGSDETNTRFTLIGGYPYIGQKRKSDWKKQLRVPIGRPELLYASRGIVFQQDVMTLYLNNVVNSIPSIEKNFPCVILDIDEDIIETVGSDSGHFYLAMHNGGPAYSAADIHSASKIDNSAITTFRFTNGSSTIIEEGVMGLIGYKWSLYGDNKNHQSDLILVKASSLNNLGPQIYMGDETFIDSFSWNCLNNAWILCATSSFSVDSGSLGNIYVYQKIVIKSVK